VYQLSKAELATELDRLGIVNEGNIDYLRRRLSRYIDVNPEYVYSALTEIVSDRLEAMEQKEDTPPTLTDTAKVMKQILWLPFRWQGSFCLPGTNRRTKTRLWLFRRTIPARPP